MMRLKNGMTVIVLATQGFCPWDVICYCDEAADGKTKGPKNYWSNTSGNDSVRHFIEKMGNGIMRGEMETLIAGETVKEIHEDLHL